MAQRKKNMIASGKLDKHGKPNTNTPADFLESYKDFSQSNPPGLSGGDGSLGPSVVASAAASAVASMDVDATSELKTADNGGEVINGDDKKRPAVDGSGDEAPSKKKKKKDKKAKKEKKCKESET
jgi:H/ACA ribonucleoprotein complex subunit 4